MNNEIRWAICRLVFSLSFVVGGIWYIYSDGELWIDLIKMAWAILLVNVITWVTLRQDQGILHE